jgi:AraC-like DNA-binding protein
MNALDSRDLPQSSQNLPFPVEEQLALPAEFEGRVWFHRSAGRVRPHRHVELEANLVTGGHATYLVGEHRFRLNRRTLIWLFPAQNHLLIDQSADFTMWIAVWKPSLVERACQHPETQELKCREPEHTWISRLELEDASRLETLLGRVSEVSSSDAVNAGLTWLLMESFAARSRGASGEAGRAVHPAIERAARLLRDEPLDVPELARRVGLSQSRLSRLFRAQIGRSLPDFRAQMALERFFKLFDSHLSLRQAAELAGFGSYAQFHRVFTAHMGCNPTTYRARSRETA